MKKLQFNHCEVCDRKARSVSLCQLPYAQFDDRVSDIDYELIE